MPTLKSFTPAKPKKPDHMQFALDAMLGKPEGRELLWQAQMENPLMTLQDAGKGVDNVATQKVAELRNWDPGWKDTARHWLADMFGGDMAAQRRVDSVLEAAELLPVTGDISAVADSRDAFAEGRKFEGAGLAALAVVGLVPGIGKPIAQGLKKGIRAYHGTTTALPTNLLGRDVPLGQGFTPSGPKFNRVIPDPRESRGDAAYMGDIGTWFSSTEDAANHYTKMSRDGGVIYAADIDLKNPKVFETYKDFYKSFRAHTGKKFDFAPDGMSSRTYRIGLSNEGHDGIVIKNSTTDSDIARTDYVVFEPDKNAKIIKTTTSYDYQRRLSK